MYRNSEGYADPTAGAALEHIANEERQKRRLAKKKRREAAKKERQPSGEQCGKLSRTRSEMSVLIGSKCGPKVMSQSRRKWRQMDENTSCAA